MRTQEQKEKSRKSCKEYYLKTKEARKEYKKKYYLENKEQILKYNEKHKEKFKETNKIYRFNNKEKIKESYKKYYLIIKEKKKKYAKEYRLKNIKSIKEYLFKNRERTNERHRNRYNTDYNFKLTCNLRRRLSIALKGKSKSASTMELIGCSIDELWNHLESQFKPWMTKKNHGLWHVDHIKACAKFDLTCPEQQRICFNYKNLQPMEAIENIRKGAR